MLSDTKLKIKNFKVHTNNNFKIYKIVVRKIESDNSFSCRITHTKVFWGMSRTVKG